LATYDANFAAVLLAFLIAAGAGVPWLALRFASAAGRRKQVLLSEQRALLVDSLQGMGELLQSGAAERNVDQVRQNSIELVSQQTRLARVDGLSQAAALLCANLAMWLILWLAVPMVEQSQLAKADLAMLALFTLATFEAVNPMLSAFKAYGETRAAMERLFEIVDAPPAVRDPTASSPRPRKFDLCFERVSFGYPAAEEPVLQDFDLCMPEGGRVTITGPSGVGKSTLVHLLARFYDPDSGRILLGGQPLTRFRGEDLRRYLSVVSQHSHLFTGTVRDNLLLGDPRAGEEALERAGRVAGIHDFIASLPDGYDTWVGEAGATLSGGEARRIALARAVLKDAPVLILDEPTEGLDASTAAGILKAVDQWAIGKTVVLISHRRLTGDAFGPVVKLDA
jgi:ATP-binding cassette subfamily C protein CydC